MKVLFISHFSFLYGSNKSLWSLINYFREKGDNVEVLLPSKGLFYDELKKEGVKVHYLRFYYMVLYVKWTKKYLSLPLLLIYNLFSFPFLVWKIKTINPDIIYANSTMDAYSVFVAKLLRKKFVWHVREYMKEDFGAYFIFGNAIKRKLILSSYKMIFVSKSVACTVIGNIPTNGKVIYNGLPTPRWIRTNEPFNNNLRIGVVGNIDISKQQHLAIEYMPHILKYFPNVSLHIIGDKECPYKKYIQNLVKNNNLTNTVIFEGFVRDVEEIYKKFDVLLMCSRSEAFGRVTIEAMLRNIAVIGYNCGGTTELINHGVTGFKFENVDDVISAIDFFVNNPEGTKMMIDAARKNASKLFSEERYVFEVYKFVHN